MAEEGGEAPPQVDITKAVHAGQNTLEVRVVNLWPNRLIGDESLQQKYRFTETNVHKFSAKTPLYPSGLDGPVTIETSAFERKLTGSSPTH